MKNEIARIKKIIDELSVFKRNYPDIKLPEPEKNRLRNIVEKILNNQGITDKEWDAFKPYNPEDPEQAEIRKMKFKADKVKRQIQDTREMNSYLIKGTEKLKKQIGELDNSIRIGMATALPAKQEYKFCEKCNKKIRLPEFEEHFKNCKPNRKQNNKYLRAEKGSKTLLD
jgi:hypothetical protein